MKIYCMILICPECKKVLTFLPHADGVFYTSTAVICAYDGRHMLRYNVDQEFIDKVLHGRIPI